jgi:hypothetical protein
MEGGIELRTLARKNKRTKEKTWQYQLRYLRGESVASPVAGVRSVFCFKVNVEVVILGIAITVGKHFLR